MPAANRHGPPPSSATNSETPSAFPSYPHHRAPIRLPSTPAPESRTPPAAPPGPSPLRPEPTRHRSRSSEPAATSSPAATRCASSGQIPPLRPVTKAHPSEPSASSTPISPPSRPYPQRRTQTWGPRVQRSMSALRPLLWPPDIRPGKSPLSSIRHHLFSARSAPDRRSSSPEQERESSTQEPIPSGNGFIFRAIRASRQRTASCAGSSEVGHCGSGCACAAGKCSLTPSFRTGASHGGQREPAGPSDRFTKSTGMDERPSLDKMGGVCQKLLTDPDALH